MKKILLAFLICNSLFVTAQITFGDQNIIEQPYINGPYSVFTVDIDGDGDLDVLSASSNDNKIVWYENIDGIGSFDVPKIITTDAEGARSVFAVDIDGDGDVDVLSASYSDDKIAWYENIDGDGNFGDQEIITTNANGAHSVYAADMDGDGDMDVLSALSSDSKVSWYENTDGNGTFGDEHSITNDAAGVRSVFAVDIDGDGDVDVLSASYDDDKIAWYENIDGDGNFGDQEIITTNANGAYSVYATDMDGDNDMDVLFTSNLGDQITWYKNSDGNGDFIYKQTISSGVDVPRSVSAADMDGDGDIDVLTASEVDNKIAWYENTDGNGTLGSQKIISVDAILAQFVCAGDIDSDGDMDVLSASYFDDNVAWYENTDGLGTFGNQQSLSSNSNSPTDIFSTDIDGDGDLDIITASFRNDKISWYENLDGFGFFGTQNIITIDALGARSVFAVDIDGDGDIDVLSASRDDYKIAWFENTDGVGTFGSQQIITLDAIGAYDVFASDIDGDGDMDVLSASQYDDKIAWYENTDGNGVFGPQQVVSDSAEGARSVYAVDIDNDGDMDVLSGSYINDEIAWYKNMDGNGNFGVKQNITNDVDSPSSIYSADIDGDGDMDILSSSSNDDKIAWYENMDGNGDFGQQQLITIFADNARDVFVSDMDGDGDLDVLSASSSDNKIAWYENTDGIGTFGSQQIISIDASGAHSVFAGDIDNDGDMDVFSASSFDDKIAWYENAGLSSNKTIGYVKFDGSQGDCLDNGLPIPNVLVTTDNGSESYSSFSLVNGFYQVFPETGEFTTTATLPDPISNYYTAIPDEYNNEFVDIGNTFTADFCLQPIGAFNDLNISILPLNDANPGFESRYRIVYKNIGTTQLSGLVVFNYDDAKLSFVSADESITAQGSNSISFDYLDLFPFESRTIDLEFTVFTPPNVQAGDVIDFEATINPIVGDETEEDNTYSFTQTVVGSYDPNDITCLQGDEILLEDADKYLHYIIRFQNTGNFYATFVRVHNTLDDRLDWNTIQMVDASHDYKVEIVDGNEVDFIFDGIYLQDSTSDETNSHGFISYKIKPKSDVVVGDIISSQAGIYFDFNPVVNTNTVHTEIVDIIDVDEPTILNFSIYPTPTGDILNITSKTAVSKVVLYNKLGQTVLETTESTINVSSLVQGIYFVKVVDENGHAGVQKIVKK